MRFDTYRGCAHGCAYCFAGVKCDLADVRRGESEKALRAWIRGDRTGETRWCNWDIPLHWGGLSDPFQPIERRLGRSLACLRVLAETGYPVVISTKSTLLTESPYRGLLLWCNAVVQVSLVAPALDVQEPGAPSYAERMRALPELAKLASRVIVRVQPYSPAHRAAVLKALPTFASAGVYGVTVEGLKCRTAEPGMVKLGPDFVWPVDGLRSDFEALQNRCHKLGLRFYVAENRLRSLGDDRCCCGIDGLAGFVPNAANLNSLLYGGRIPYTRRMRQTGTAGAFKACAQDAVSTAALAGLSYAEGMELVRRVEVYRRMIGLPTAQTARKSRPAGAGCVWRVRRVDRGGGQQPAGREGPCCRYGGGLSVGTGRSELSGGRLVPSARVAVAHTADVREANPGTASRVSANAGWGASPAPRKLVCPAESGGGFVWNEKRRRGMARPHSLLGLRARPTDKAGSVRRARPQGCCSRQPGAVLITRATACPPVNSRDAHQ